MRVYILRHGDAEMPYVDRHRPLSELGRHQVENLARLLRQRQITFAPIYHSGILRAVQTAQHLGAVLQVHDVAHMDGLQPESPPDLMLHLISEFDSEPLLVSHLPFVGKLVSLMVTGHTRRDVLLFDTCTLACLTYVGGSRWALEWALSPALFA